MDIEQLLKALGRCVYYHAGLAKHFGGVNPALFFSQIRYWQGRTDNPLGVYKSAEALREETGMTYREQASARAQLQKLGILIETHKRLEHRIYFRIDYRALQAFLASVENCNSRNAENAIGGTTKAQVVNKDKEMTSEMTTKKPRASLADDGGEHFKTFWSAYPKKAGKDAAKKAFVKRKFDEQAFEKVMAALNEQKASEQWVKDAGQFIPHPATWLNQGRFDDELSEGAAPAAGGVGNFV